MKKSKQEIKKKIVSLSKSRKNNSTDMYISSSEVTRDLFSDVWRDHLDTVRNMAGELKSKKLVQFTDKPKTNKIDKPTHSVRLSILKSKD